MKLNSKEEEMEFVANILAEGGAFFINPSECQRDFVKKCRIGGIMVIENPLIPVGKIIACNPKV